MTAISSAAPRISALAAALPAFVLAATLSLAGAGIALAAGADESAAPATDNQDYSVAERALFMSEHLRGLSAPAQLEYRFHKGGSLEAGFDDEVRIHLTARADGACCRASGDFLSAERRTRLPEIDEASGNPVLLYFLEHDVRDMQRLTKGQPAHFRKRIRMAIYRGAEVRDAQFNYQGKTIAGREIRITPYVDDPARARFERFADKEYVFMLSDAVPGGVYGIRTRIPASAQEALLAEEMYIAGASAPVTPATFSAELSR